MLNIKNVVFTVSYCTLYQWHTSSYTFSTDIFLYEYRFGQYNKANASLIYPQSVYLT